MSPTDTLVRMIREREHDIAELQGELDALHRALADDGTVRSVGNGEDKPPLKRGDRQAILRKVMKDAGRDGLTRTEIIERMAPLCDSTSGSISGMLSLLARKRQIIRTGRGRWRAMYAR